MTSHWVEHELKRQTWSTENCLCTWVLSETAENKEWFSKSAAYSRFGHISPHCAVFDTKLNIDATCLDHFIPTTKPDSSLTIGLYTLEPVWHLHVLPVPRWVVPGCSDFLPQSKNLARRFESECGWLVVSLRGPTMNWRLVCGVTPPSGPDASWTLRCGGVWGKPNQEEGDWGIGPTNGQFVGLTGGGPLSRPRTCWRVRVDRLAWENLGVPLEELVVVVGKKKWFEFAC